MQPRILIVDDDNLIRELSRLWLTRAGYQCLEASNGAEAREIATTEFPDMIIMDCYLSGENGIDIIYWLKGNETTSHIPVLGLTADPYARRNFMTAGADDQLTKPVGQHLFMHKVMSLLKTSRQIA